MPHAARRKGGVQIERAYFRREFEGCTAERLTLKLTAVDRYRLYINGVPAHAGPARGDRYRQFVDTIDLTPFLSDGINILAAVVTSYVPPEAIRKIPEETDEPSPGPVAIMSRAGGALLLAFCPERPELSSHEPGWKICADNSVTFKRNIASGFTAPTEILDMSRYPAGWDMAGFDDSAWLTPDLLWPAANNFYGELPPFPLHERPIPLLYHERRDFERAMPPQTVPARTHTALILDAGELLCGYFHATTEGGTGAKLTFTYAESYVGEDGHKADRSDPGGVIIGKSDTLLPSGGVSAFDRQEMLAMRFVRIDIETADEPVTLIEAHMLTAGYPLEAITRIEPAEPWMGALWDISLRTLRRCMFETYMDCPYYEQLQYTQDSRLQMLFTYRVSGDTRMALRTIEDYHASLLPEGIMQSRYPCQITQVIEPFALHWIFMLEDYYWQTADLDTIRRYRPSMDAVLGWFERRLTRDGLVGRLAYWPFLDWVDGWPYGDPPAALEEGGVASVFSMVYAMALDAAARLTRATGRPGTADEYTARADAVRAAVNQYCYSEERDVYLDGPGREELSQHAQIFAVLSGCASSEQAKSILTRALDDEAMARCTFTMQYYFFRALESAGMYERTRELWDPYISLLSQNLTTIPEWLTEPRSDCHAWGALALYEFPAHLLGVRPDAPGWELIRIEPQAQWLPSLSGSVVTPKGVVTAAYARTEKGIRLHGASPEGVPLKLCANSRERLLPTGGTFDETL
ncbi:MAG: hypothetical protein FWC62_02055 [Firmicutes bacterium]|nr:hypothetical protein [Bacillota bacterium]